MKNINYKMKYIYIYIYIYIYTDLFVRKNFWRPAIIQNISCVYKENVKHDKNQINLIFFVKKTGVEDSKLITHSSKKDYGTQFLLTPSFDNHNVIFDL